jgi:photosystem II stability/assembly factor-like uncharacterized protein
MTKALLCALPVLLATAFAKAPGPAPRFDAWRIIGPGGGGTMIAPTISPHDPNLVVEHCDMTGAYITHDGGSSWRMFNLRSVVNTFAFDPKNANVIYAGNAALWRSADNGRSWRMVFPDPRKNTVEHQLGDHSGYVLTSMDPAYPGKHGEITAIAVDPADARRIHVAFAEGHGASVLVESNDGGRSWKQTSHFAQPVLKLVFGGSGLLAVSGQSVYRVTNDDAQALSPLNSGIRAVSAAHNGSAVWFYATTRDGVFVSEDSGRTWHAATPPLGQESGRFEAIAASEEHATTAYVGFRNLQLGAGRANRYNGIAKTVDGGKSWKIVHQESNKPSTNLTGSWIEERAPQGGHDIWFDAPYSLGVAPTNPDICYATDLFRTYRTLDGGKTWEEVNSVKVAADRWTTRGLDVTTNYGVHFDPFDRRHVFIDYTDIGAFQSYDGGASWQTATVGVPERWRNTTYWLAFDPEVKGLMWGAFSGVHDLPRPKMWRHRDPLSFVGGVAVSTDGGKHWVPSNEGMPETSVTHILVDPKSPAGKRTIYACGFGRGVYKSTDNGKTWALKNDGIAGQKPFAWRITRADDGTLYLVVARSNEGRYGETTGSGALYKSVDGAEHWTKMALPAGTNGPNGLTLDPRDNRRMYLAAWGQERSDVDTGGGVFLSTDAGGTWRPIFQNSQHVYDVTVDPKKPDVLYICGFDAAAYRSPDRGAHWVKIRGYNFKWGHRVIPDPEDTSKIYITTYGGSVWHGPAMGDPKAAGDIKVPVPVAH